MSKNDQRKKFNRQMSDSRKAIEAFAKLDEEKYIKKNYMRSVQAPLGVRPRLVTWMELC